MENPIIKSLKRADQDDFNLFSNSHGNESGGSGDEDDFTDADAAIDRMLDELQDFQFQLDGTGSSQTNKTNDDNVFGNILGNTPSSPKSPGPKSPNSPQITTFSSSLDHLRFSSIAIEDTPDVDLDALLEDLCCMEKDIVNAEKKSVTADNSATDSGISSNSSLTLSSVNSTFSGSTTTVSSQNYSAIRSPMSPMSPRSPKSPVPANVTSDVRNRLENLQEETRELTPEEQEARFKAEKIKIALEKMKAASVQKLVVKVFEENLETSKTMLIDQTWTARDVASKMIKKNDVEADPNWCLVEKLPDLYMERIMEEDEAVLPIIFDWTRDTTNMLVFSKRRDKYTLFRNPQNFLLASGTSVGAAQLAEKSKDILLGEFFAKEHTRIPEVEGVLWLKEGKRTWNKHFFVLRASGVYYTPKGKAKASRDLICLVKFEHASVYLGIGVKKKYRAPTDNIFCLKHPKVQTGKSKHVYFLCTEDQKTMQQWVIAIRMAKYGYQMYVNYLQTQENVEKELMLTSLANRGTASVKFQDDEEEFSEKPGNLRRRTSESFKGSAREGIPQVKSSSTTVRVKGQGTSNLGSLFSNAWKKGSEETNVGMFSPTTPGNAAEDSFSPEPAPPTFNIANRASTVSSRSSIKSNRSSIKSRSSISEPSRPVQLNPPPAGKNGRMSMNGSIKSPSNAEPVATFSQPAAPVTQPDLPPPPSLSSSVPKDSATPVPPAPSVQPPAPRTAPTSVSPPPPVPSSAPKDADLPAPPVTQIQPPNLDTDSTSIPPPPPVPSFAPKDTDLPAPPVTQIQPPTLDTDSTSIPPPPPVPSSAPKDTDLPAPPATQIQPPTLDTDSTSIPPPPPVPSSASEDTDLPAPPTQPPTLATAGAPAGMPPPPISSSVSKEDILPVPPVPISSLTEEEETLPAPDTPSDGIACNISAPQPAGLSTLKEIQIASSIEILPVKSPAAPILPSLEREEIVPISPIPAANLNATTVPVPSTKPVSFSSFREPPATKPKPRSVAPPPTESSPEKKPVVQHGSAIPTPPPVPPQPLSFSTFRENKDMSPAPPVQSSAPVLNLVESKIPVPPPPPIRSATLNNGVPEVPTETPAPSTAASVPPPPPIRSSKPNVEAPASSPAPPCPPVSSVSPTISPPPPPPLPPLNVNSPTSPPGGVDFPAPPPPLPPPRRSSMSIKSTKN
eukprot:gene3172-3642_t